LTPSNKQEPEEECQAISETLARIGDKWTVLVVELLAGSPMRFNEIRRTIGNISQRMLTLTLRELERDGLVTRTVFSTIPPRVEYQLTKLGRTLREPLIAVAEWVRKHQPAMVEARNIFDAAGIAKPSHRREPRRGPAILTRSRIPTRSD
jgi:DNA-binding HxlR family transcriptional regulator